MGVRQIDEAEVAQLVDVLQKLGSNIAPSQDAAWTNPVAVKIIDCVLSLNRPYDRFVVPRLELFKTKHPQIITAAQLAEAMAAYSDANAFVEQELNYKHVERAVILDKVVQFVCQITSTHAGEDEELILQQWAKSAPPDGYKSLKIRGFAIAGFQYLRMLFGASTTKPDVHIIGFVTECIGRKVNEIESLRLLEEASARAGVSLLDVDTTIWELRARGESVVAEKSETPVGPSKHTSTMTKEQAITLLKQVLAEAPLSDQAKDDINRVIIDMAASPSC